MSNQNRVFVIDKNKNPLMPCHPARARELLKNGRAAVFRRYPFTIILKDRVGGDTQPQVIKVDPGSRITGLAVVAYGKNGAKVIFAAEIEHRGWLIKKKLDGRRSLRRSRRNRKIRYRQPRFNNRKREKGWLPPSLMSRVHNINTWVSRLMRFSPITGLAMELVRFDTQKMQNTEVSGIEYQQGELQGYEVKEYLLEKWGRKCAYCDAENVPLEVEHIKPRSRGGSNRVSNLTISCTPCNQKKNNMSIEDFLANDQERLKHILSGVKRPLKDAAIVNSTRWKLFDTLKAYGLPVEIGSGGITKYNRIKQNFPKAHWIDAACVGESGLGIELNPEMQALNIKAMGHGNRQMCLTDKFGFPKAHKSGIKVNSGFMTGDLASADVPTGKYKGVYSLGRVVIRKVNSFGFTDGKTGKKYFFHHKYLTKKHSSDGYSYTFMDI